MASRTSRKGKDRMRHSRMAPLSVGLLLVSVFFIIGMRWIDWLALSGVVFLLSAGGYFLGASAERRIRRHHMVIQGHAAAMIGKWGNLGLLVLSAVYFAFDLARSIISGQIDL
jgi:hypothetical protein